MMFLMFLLAEVKRGDSNTVLSPSRSQTVMCWLTKIICIFLFVDQDKAPPRRSSNAWLTQLLHHVGEHAGEIPVPLLLWTLFSSAATVCLLNSLRSRAHHHQHESLQNKHADKQAAGRTCSKVAQEDEKKHEDDDGKEQEEDATSEGEIEEEVNTEEMKVDSLKKRKWGVFDRLRTLIPAQGNNYPKTPALPPLLCQNIDFSLFSQAGLRDVGSVVMHTHSCFPVVSWIYPPV